MTRDEGIEDEPWFADGLRFKCTGCGGCCTGASASVRVSSADLQRLAAHLSMPVGRFARRFTRVVKGRRLLLDRDGSGDCIFLSGKACTVYEARPTQCRTFPWWPINLIDAESWAEAAHTCEGIDHPDGAIVPAAGILEQRRLDIENDSAP